jgi:cytochrome b6-f complex iron-sulfur subunit
VSPGTIALIIVAVSILGWAAFMANVTIRKHREGAAAVGGEPKDGSTPAASPSARPVAATASPSAAGAGGGDVTVEKVPEKKRKPLSPEELAVSRRQFLNRAWSLSFIGFLGLFGMSSLSFLWPKLTGGFGTKINAGNYEEILAKVGPEGNFTPLFISEGRFWLTYYEGTGDAPVYAAINAIDTKVQALYRKCVHLGCSVPHCEKSMLFECPCHGSKYRLHGEYFGGPAPRGLDRFPVAIEGGSLIVDTGKVQVGPPRGTNTWDKFSEPQGTFCVPV